MNFKRSFYKQIVKSQHLLTICKVYKRILQKISILYFMLLLRKGEIRTMKYLGTNTVRICKCYIGEYLFECVLGTSIGAGIVSVSQLIEKSLMWYQFKMGIVFDIIAILVPGIVAIQIYQKGDRS